MQFCKSVILITLFFLLSFTILLNAQEAGGPYETDENTILLLHFDGNLTNNSTLSNDAVPHGNSMAYSSNTPLNTGQSLRIDNSNTAVKNYVSVPHNNSLSLSDSWTIEAWVNFTSIGSNSSANPTIISKTSSSSQNYFLWYHNSWGSTKGQFTNSNNDATYIAIGNNTITTGTWYHIAYVRNNDEYKQKLIIRNQNKEIIAESTYQYGEAASTPILNTNDLIIGSLFGVDGFYFDGYIDEIRISNVARDFRSTLEKPQLTSENFIIYYDDENSSSTNTIISQLQNKTDFYKKYFRYFFNDHSKIFSVNICKDLDEFNQSKPDGLPDFETSYIKDDILYIVAPSTAAQNDYFDGFEQAAMHGFTKMFVDYEYNGTASEWMKYGFARHQSGMKSTPGEIRAETLNLGRNPTMQEMNNWDQITAFDKYAFAYTIFQYVADVHSFNYIFNQIRFNNNSVQYGFRNFNTEAEFEEAWHYSLDLFYLRESHRMEFQRETDHFYLYMVDEDLPDIDQWENELEAFYTRFTNDMQMTLGHKIHIYYYPALCDYHYIQGADDCPEGSVGEALGIDLGKFTRKYPNDPVMNTMSLAQHELTHVIQGNMDFESVKKWQSEGLATLMPDGLISEELIDGSTGVIKEQVNIGFSEVVASAGRYPTIDDFESDEFVNQHADDNLMYYLLGAVLVDYIIKTSGYLELKAFIETNSSDYTTLGFTDKVHFMNSFYTFYQQNWKTRPQLITANNVQSPVNIDGNINESDWNLNQNVEGIYPFYQDWSNNTSEYSALWDEDYLYVAVKVIDRNLTNSSSDGWNDGVAVYIDADFNKGYQYDSFDRHFTKWWNNSELTEKNNRTTGVLHSEKNINGGYTVEMAIPWSNLGITPSTNTTIGFDVSNIVNDNGSKYQLIWSGNNLNTGTTINFGELSLAFNSPPIVSNIPDQTINEGSNFSTIQLDSFVNDTDNEDSDISWSFTGNSDLNVVINGNREATVTTPNQEWNGSETITFTATDPSNATDSYSVTFTVTGINDGPVISSIPNQVIDEGGSFTTVSLDDFVTDPDNVDSELVWTFVGNNELSIEVNANRIVTVSIPGENWFGSETITFTASDPDNVSNSRPVSFTVNPVNDPPVIIDAPEVVEFISDTSFTVDIWSLVSDVETPSEELQYGFRTDNDLILTDFDASSGVLTISAILEFGGEGSLIWSASDSELIVKDTIRVIVDKAVILDVDGDVLVPKEFALYQNYPNPFNPSTMIKYAIPVNSNVRIEIFNLLGQSVGLLINSEKAAGIYQATWDASKLPSGTYICRIISGTYSESRKMLLLR